MASEGTAAARAGSVRSQVARLTSELAVADPRRTLRRTSGGTLVDGATEATTFTVFGCDVTVGSRRG
jgi:hypothetical protein